MAAGVYTFGQDLLSLAAAVIPLDSPQYFHNFNVQQKKRPPRRAARQTAYDGVSVHEGDIIDRLTQYSTFSRF